MSRRTLVKASLALVIVLIASLSTVRVHQAWGEQQARSGFDAAQQRARVALARAARVGLLRSELRPYRQRARAIRAAPAPGASPLWGSQESFYDRQARAYRALAARVRAAVKTITTSTRSQALSTLSGLATAIPRAQLYDLNVTESQARLTSERTAFASAITPRAFRQISSSTHSAIDTLDAVISARSKKVSSMLSSGGNSARGVAGTADAEAESARGRLSLIGLFSAKAAQLGAELTRIDSSVHAQRSAFATAVKASELHDLSAQITALYSKIVPAKLIVVSTGDQWARMYENGSEVYNTAVTTGGPELPTDLGVFHIYDKISPFTFHSPWPIGSPYYYLPSDVSYWMPFDGGEGLHDAPWRSNFGPGSNFAPTDLGTGNSILGTHGCVNMPADAAAFVWNWAPIGTTVVVT